MNSLNMFIFCVMVTANVFLTFTYFSEPRTFGASSWALITSLSSGTWTVVTSLSSGTWTIIDRLSSVSFMNDLKEVLLDAVARIFLLVASVRMFAMVYSGLVTYAIWNNWEETKRVIAAAATPVFAATAYIADLASKPDKILVYILIVLFIQTYPLIVETISNAALKPSLGPSDQDR